MKKVLVVGSGGREHALVWKLSQEAEVFCTPGNAGISEACPTYGVAASDADGISILARELAADLVLIGPEDPLIAGVTDHLRSNGQTVFGPSAKFARHEASKAWSKEFMHAAGIPTAASDTFMDFDEAMDWTKSRFESGRQVAVKASGAALGKGVVVASTLEEAEVALRSMLVEGSLGTAGSTVVVEDRLVGREFSLLTLVGGPDFQSLPVVQDYKRIGDGDLGPNTGGMGSYCPVGWVTEGMVREVEETIVGPAVKAMQDLDGDYRGVLFSGVMVVDDRPFCLEFNVRFGDPETQSVVRRIGGGFFEALVACAQGSSVPSLDVLDDSVVTVVAASEGYPGPVQKGRTVTIGPMPEGVVVFHAGTARSNGNLMTNGGRVLAVSAAAQDLAGARRLAYEGMERVRFDGMQFRKDIAL